MIRFSLSTRGLTGDVTRPLADQIDDAADTVRFAAGLRSFTILRAPSHWISHPTIWAEPIPLLARLAPEAGEMELLTSVLKLPLHNPVELAHLVATLDHIAHGRLILGVGLGYHEGELRAVGSSRKERVARFEESVAIMNALWSGETVDHEGRFWSVTDARMGYVPVQRMRPPLWNAANRDPAARRAAALCDGLYIADQATWPAAAELAGVYRDALGEVGKPGRGVVGLNRTMAVGRTHEEAYRAAAAREAASSAYYTKWGMKEATMSGMGLQEGRNFTEWTIVGTPEECVEQLRRQDEAIGIDFVGLNFANMPNERSARRDYLQWVSEEVLIPAGAALLGGAGA
jgi:alkanesulfonate monooxygenase SsuD/methylene tetrahydromethanopterin reductase-like flavin-dependent oxidoreductase (luciferase family)